MRALDDVGAWPVGAAAAVVLGATGPPGGGVEEVGAVGDRGASFRWASLTKLCTALAALVAVEEGTVALEDEVGPPGSTVAHLLAHASGLAPDRPGVLAAPGRRRIYSNAGFELLGHHLEAAAGMPFGDYLADAVFDPLGMATARLDPGGSPAHGAAGSVADLAALGRELLVPTLVAAGTHARATAVAFPGIAGVLPGFGSQDPCDWGLGPEIRAGKHPHWTGRTNSRRTFGHFGRAGGFLWIDPEAAVACAVLTDREFGPWAAASWPALADRVLADRVLADRVLADRVLADRGRP